MTPPHAKNREDRKTFLDIVPVYRPRRELQKAAPRNFDAFFEPVYFEKQKKTVEIPAVRARFILAF